MFHINVPEGHLSNTDDAAAAARRRELREKLIRGEEVKVTPSGNVKGADDTREEGIVVPEGKLAHFHWYDRDKKLFKGEKAAMKRYFPQFKLDKLSDGRLFWHGPLSTDLRPRGRWYLQAVYDNNHPHNNTYGGSVKVYAVEPDLETLQERLGEPIPHLLKDAGGNLYMCTARMEDVTTGRTVTSAASSLSWAAKWISAFELWMAGELSTEYFAGHKI